MGRRSFLTLLHPDVIVPGTVLMLSREMFRERGIKGIIFDVDKTLVPMRQSTLSPEVKQWITQIQLDFLVWLVSNNTSHTRISQIAASIQAPHIYRAAKPSRRALRRAIQDMQLDPSEVAMVGDRRLTDILAGNRLGLLTVLVRPLGGKQA
jgi:HAD superfamily phosphatase (TIGR01668 family)